VTVYCTIEDVLLAGPDGPTPGLCVSCDLCGHEVHATGRKGVVWALVLMREQCPEGELNEYEAILRADQWPSWRSTRRP
jgi:hypothetical protein